MTTNFRKDYRSAVEYAIVKGFLGKSGNSHRAHVDYGGHGFWIHPIRTAMDSEGRKTVTGQISHILGYGQPDDQAYFCYVFQKDGTVSESKVNINQGGYGQIAHTVLDAAGTVAAAFGYPAAAAALVGASTIVPALTQPIESIFVGDWKSALRMILAEVMVQTIPALRFYWSYAGDWPGRPQQGYVSLLIDEPADPGPWGDNYLLIENPRNMACQWSHAGQLAGWHCVSFNEPSDPNTWRDNYLCFKGDDQYDIRFSNEGPLGGYGACRILEPGDPHTWTDNYLCYRTKA
jgi:hypothetical protein